MVAKKASKKNENSKTKEQIKSLLQFVSEVDPTMLKSEELSAFIESKSKPIIKLAESEDLDSESLENHCVDIYSAIRDHYVKIGASEAEADSNAKLAVEKTLDFFSYTNKNYAIRELMFESAAEDPDVESYIDGKRLLPPGKHKNGYSVGVVRKREE